MNTLFTSQKMGLAAIILASSVLLSRVMGLLRDKVISWQFGAAAETDIYFTAFVLPDFINHLLAGGYISITLIPLLAKRFAEQSSQPWRLFAAVFYWSIGLSVIFTAVAWWYAPIVTPWLAPGFSEVQLERLTFFLRIVLPAQLFFIPGACLTAILYIRKQFFIPALTPIIYNGCIILGGVCLPFLVQQVFPQAVLGMEGYCFGVLFGALFGAFIMPLWGVWRGGIDVRFAWRDHELKRLLFLALPLMLGLSVTVFDEQLIRIFGSLAGEGAVSLLNYARRIMMVPVGVVAQAAGVASFPFLAALVAKGDHDAFNATLHKALRGSIYVVLPLCGAMIAVSEPMLGFLFEGGQFRVQDTRQTAPLLQIMLLAVPFWTIQQVIGRAFYAKQDTLTPTLVGSTITVVVFFLYPLAVEAWGILGVALMTTISLSLYALVLSLMWRYKHDGYVFRDMAKPLIIGGVFSATGVVLAHVVGQTVLEACAHLPTLLKHIVVGASGVSVFAVVYLALAKCFWPDALKIR